MSCTYINIRYCHYVATSFFSRPSSNLNREPSSDSSLSTSASADSSSSSNASEDPELATPPSEPQQEAVYTCSCEEAEKVEGDVDTTGLSSDTSLTTLDLSTSSCGRKERRHYRSTKVLEFEGRHSPGQVWICSKKPRSPMPGWITPADMKSEFVFIVLYGFKMCNSMLTFLVQFHYQLPIAISPQLRATTTKTAASMTLPRSQARVIWAIDHTLYTLRQYQTCKLSSKTHFGCAMPETEVRAIQVVAVATITIRKSSI